MVDIQQAQNYKQFWTVGSGSSGLLLNGSLDDIHKFQQINVESVFDKDSQITQLEIDGMMGFYLTSKGEVYKFGECEYDEKNKDNQILVLKIKPIVNPNPQKMISLKAPIIKISCGWSHAMFVDNSHRIYGVGSNKFGELGLGKNKKLAKDIEIIPFTDQQSEDVYYHEIYEIKCTFRQSFIVTKQKSQVDFSQDKYNIYCTGQNKSFELGGFKDEGVLYNFKQNSQLLETVGSIKKFICGYKFACILTNSNQLYGYRVYKMFKEILWGDNKYGQLTGDDPTCQKVICITEDVLEACAGWNHLLILKINHFLVKDNNQLFAVGRGDMGQIGDGQTKNVKILQQIKGVEGDIQVIECGSEANYVKSTAGIYIWGWNEHGNLGNGNLENVYKPTLLPFENHRQINQVEQMFSILYFNNF